MSGLFAADFGAFFEALHGTEPYPWQRRLAEMAIEGRWPDVIDLPTGSGKTACIDIAIFALACQANRPLRERSAPRRIFFCVNRRVIVDEACRRAEAIAEQLWKAERGNEDSVLRRVAGALRAIAGSQFEKRVPPIDVVELRGGIYRDNRWSRSVTQPMVVCTTIDQLGSRLLFRGYGVSRGAAPIQAALIAYDSLVLLDEAHISNPFRQTLDRVHAYLDGQRWAEQDIGVRPMVVVPMTATPGEGAGDRVVLSLGDGDRAVPSLRARLGASKVADLVEVTDIKKHAPKLALSLAKERPSAIGIIVNRVATARAIYDALLEERRKASISRNPKIAPDTPIELVIGSMRPLDRDAQADRLRDLVGPGRPDKTERTCIVVATQCLEVGADYDFDALITECASIDALRQRFGRLNRRGRDITARAVILINKKDADKANDAIYGNALAQTWKWLNEHASTDPASDNDVKSFDFGIEAFDRLVAEHGDNGRIANKLLVPSAKDKAPVILPAYVDLWCQTAPRPAPDPDVALFLHGPQQQRADVQVCWRADLVEDGGDERDQWVDIVSLLPPTSAECMSVPIGRVRKWLEGDSQRNLPDNGDLLEGGKDDPGEEVSDIRRCGVIWRGPDESRCIKTPSDLRPGDTLVLPASTEGSELLGHLPELNGQGDDASGENRPQPSIRDLGEQAFAQSRDRAALRLHPSLRASLPQNSAFDRLIEAASSDEPVSKSEWQELLRQAAETIGPDDESCRWLRERLEHLACGQIHVARYPDDRGVVLISQKRVGTRRMLASVLPEEDESSRIDSGPVLLDDHAEHVRKAVRNALAQLPLEQFAPAFDLAARLHDLGKADERFQALLRGSSRTYAWLTMGIGAAILAKSAGGYTTPAEYREACERVGLPVGWRHEMLSMQLAEHAGLLGDDASMRDLILHLIASHHGHARPFAPVVPDDELPGVEVEMKDAGVEHITLTQEERRRLVPAHRLDSGIADRFWRLTHRFGWWGLAYLEAVLRLADQQASDGESAGQYAQQSNEQPAEVSA